MKVQIYIEGERLDLFQDESINISQGVQDVRDISKLFADFSQSFNVPASDNNNRIFKHYYNADIDGGFDARTRKPATIDVNTLDFKRGKIQLESVAIKDNAPASYKITFFGDAIKIKDQLGEDKLFDLDYLSNFDHDYSGSEVQTNLTSGKDFTIGSKTYTDGIIYPLISYTKQYKYDSDPSDTTNTDTLVNIAYDAGRTQGVDFGDLKPAIKLEAVVDAIEDRYGFEFTGGFFESDNYKDIYMSLNNSTEQLNAGTIVVENESGTNPPESARDEDKLRYRVDITPNVGFTSVGYKIRLTWNGETIYEDNEFQSGTRRAVGFVERPTENYNVTTTIFTEEDFEFDAETYLRYQFEPGFTQDIFINNYNNQVIDLRVKILELMYDIKVYDFLTSIFKMFNLIVTPDGTDILVEDLNTWYEQGQIYDITKWIDTSKLTVEKGKIFSQINFSFEDSDQILADRYNKNNRRYYGNSELKLYTDNTQTTLLDGETLDIEVVFERPVYERLVDLDTNNYSNVQYCLYTDKDLDSLTGNPFLFYAPSVDVSGSPIGFNTEGSYLELSSTVFLPSQNRDINDVSSFSLNFNAELSEYTFQAMQNNIYSIYYQDYVSDTFSIKRRNFKLDAIFPDEFLQRLKLNDRLVIADRRYVINRLTSNLVNRRDSIELLNDIFTTPLIVETQPFGLITADNTTITADNTLITVDNG